MWGGGGRGGRRGGGPRPPPPRRAPPSRRERAAATGRWLVGGAGARFPEGMSFPAREADRFVFVDDAWPLPFQDRIGEAITLRISEQLVPSSLLPLFFAHR